MPMSANNASRRSRPAILKGVPMLDSGSAFGDETLTIRFATLENPEIFGWKYPAVHIDEITAKLTFWIVAERGLNSAVVG